jgi:small subunit ribosomal protein S6
MANRYETVFIMTSVLSEDQTKETVKKFISYIKGAGASITYDESWGLKKLAYPIQKKSTGFYHLIEFEAEAEIIKPLETEFIRDERVMRFLTVKMDKDHIEFAESRRNKSKKSTNA